MIRQHHEMGGTHADVEEATPFEGKCLPSGYFEKLKKAQHITFKILSQNYALKTRFVKF